MHAVTLEEQLDSALRITGANRQIPSIVAKATTTHRERNRLGHQQLGKLASMRSKIPGDLIERNFLPEVSKHSGGAVDVVVHP